MKLNRLLLAVMIVAAATASPALAADRKPIPVAKLDRTSAVDFEKEVLPLLNASCLACHNRNKPKAGLVLETPADILKGGESGPAVVAGKPEASLLVASAAHAGGEDVSPMPPPGNKVNAAALTSEQLGLLSLWVKQGATGEVKGAAPLAWRAVPDAVKPVYAVAITPDGQLAAAGRGTSIDLYPLPGGKVVTKLADPALQTGAHRDLVQSLAFSTDGNTLASGSYREVKLWTRQGDAWKLSGAIGTGGPDSPLADRVISLDFSRDGNRLAIGGGVPSRSGQVVLWSVGSKKIERTLDEVHTDTVTALQFSADGKRLVTGSADKFVRLVDADTGKVIRSFEGHTHHVLGVALRADGKVIASAGADNAVQFWDVETGDRRKAGAKLEKEATCVRFLGQAESVVVTGGDGKVKIYRDTGAEVRSLPGPTDFVYCAAASADGKTIVAGGQDGALRAWSGDGKVAGEWK